MANKTEISQWLSTAVNEYCTGRSTAMFLTQLGHQFRYAFEKNFQEICHEENLPAPLSKLAPFIQAFCEDLELLPFDDMLDKVAVRPRDMPNIPHPAEISVSSRTDTTAPRYRRAFWAGFIKPLSEKERRLLNFEPAVWWEDVPDTQEPGTNQVEIERDFIVAVEPGETLSTARVRDKITEWISQGSLTLDRFIDTKKPFESGVRRKSASAYEEPSGIERDIPRQFFKLFPEEMKKRLQIPADIVEFLLSLPK